MSEETELLKQVKDVSHRSYMQGCEHTVQIVETIHDLHRLQHPELGCLAGLHADEIARLKDWMSRAAATENKEGK